MCANKEILIFINSFACDKVSPAVCSLCHLLWLLLLLWGSTLREGKDAYIPIAFGQSVDNT